MNSTHTHKRSAWKMRAAGALVAGAGTLASGGDGPYAYIVEGSGYFGAPGIELAHVGRVDLSDPSQVEVIARAADDLRFGGADLRPGTGELVGFENTTNALRIFDLVNGGNTLIDSIGYMDAGVAAMSFSNDGSVVYAATTVGGFARIVEADADTGKVLGVHNILGLTITSLAVVPDGHPTLTAGELYGLTLTSGGGVRLAHIDLDTNSVVSQPFVGGIGFSPQFETGLDFASDGTLYAVIQGFDQLSPDEFIEISSHLYTIDPATGDATDLGPIEAQGTWDAVTLVIDEGPALCLADLTGDGELDFFDVSEFLDAFGAQDPIADFTGDGEFDFFDVSDFLDAFGKGCP